MYKGIVVLKRSPELSREEFEAWFTGEHLNYARSCPDLVRYTGSFTREPGPKSDWADEDSPPIDIVSEVWAEDLAGIKRAFTQLQSMGGPDDTLAHTSSRIAVIAEELVVFDRQ